jgi:hypothetical protein
VLRIPVSEKLKQQLAAAAIAHADEVGSQESEAELEPRIEERTSPPALASSPTCPRKTAPISKVRVPFQCRREPPRDDLANREVIGAGERPRQLRRQLPWAELRSSLRRKICGTQINSR